MIARWLPVSAVILTLSLGSAPACATDTDGPDCGRAIEDFGDAPEGATGFPIYGFVAFPTCLFPSAAGNVQNVVPTRGSAPGPTGYVRHVQSGASNYWLGCTTSPGGIGGVDSETNGKYSGGIGEAGCGDGPLPDCDLFGSGQDECDSGTDAGVSGVLFVCYAMPGAVVFTTGNCGVERSVYLNVLVDLNNDGDWNDNLPCRDPGSVYCGGPCTSPDGAAHEWAVKNQLVTLPGGCSQHEVPRFETGPAFESSLIWMRVSLTDDPVSNSFPWAGSANRPDGSYAGGETEDHLVIVTTPDAAKKSTWGELKIRYR